LVAILGGIARWVGIFTAAIAFVWIEEIVGRTGSATIVFVLRFIVSTTIAVGAAIAMAQDHEQAKCYDYHKLIVIVIDNFYWIKQLLL
jgi:hypothetical protein